MIELWSEVEGGGSSHYRSLRYANFSVADEASGYVLRVAGFSSPDLSATTSNGLGGVDGRPFATRDHGQCQGKAKVTSSRLTQNAPKIVRVR